jgi:hypothetical protein
MTSADIKDLLAAIPAGQLATIHRPFAGFRDMALYIKDGPEAQAFMEMAQSRMLAQFSLLGFEVESDAWYVRPDLSLDPELVTHSRSVKVMDPLSNVQYDIVLRLAMKYLPKKGCLMTLKTEARRLPEDEVVVPLTDMLFLSWDKTDLKELDEALRRAARTLAAHPEQRFAPEDFQLLPKKLTAALAP